MTSAATYMIPVASVPIRIQGEQREVGVVGEEHVAVVWPEYGAGEPVGPDEQLEHKVREEGRVGAEGSVLGACAPTLESSLLAHDGG